MTVERSENVSIPGGRRLDLRFLGAPTVLLHGNPVKFRSRKVLALLVFLTVEGGVHRRELLVELLWPESDARKGATTLRSTLSRLRDSLGEAATVLESDSTGVRVTLGVSDVVDVYELIAQAEAGDRGSRATGRISSGRFLDGFSVAGASDFDDWVARWSSICQVHSAGLFDRLSARALEHGRLSEAEDLAGQWQSSAPFDDGPVARLIEVDARRGARESALERYSRHVENLASELGAQPDVTLRALVARVQDGDLAHSSPAEALREHLAAGQAALDRDDARDAVVALDQAVALLDTVSPTDTAELTLPVLETRARALELCQAFEAARDDYQRLIDRATDHHDLTWRLRGLVGLAALHATPTTLAAPELARDYARDAVDLARLLGDSESEARAEWAMLLEAHYGRGDEEEALTHGLRGLAAARSLVDSSMLPRLLNDLHWVYAARGELAAADEVLREAIEGWQRIGDRSMLADSLNGGALLATLRGDFDAALAFAERGHVMAREGLNLWNQLAINANLGLLRREVGEYDRGISALRAACDIAADTMPAARVYYRLTLAILLGDLGLADRVEAICDELEALTIDLPEFWLVPDTIATLRVRTRAGTGAVDAADLDFVEALADSPLGLSPSSVLAPAVACWLALQLGQPARTLSIARRHLDGVGAASTSITRPEVLLALAAAHLDLGATDAAADALTDWAVAADAIGSRRLRWRQRLVAARLHDATGNAAQAKAQRAGFIDARDEIRSNLPVGPYRESFETLVARAAADR